VSRLSGRTVILSIINSSFSHPGAVDPAWMAANLLVQGESMRSWFGFFVFSAPFVISARAQTKPMQIYFIDVEGGQSTLIVSPSGASMLVDTGWPGFNNRDADRIAAAAKSANVRKLDYVVITHYHTDHVGGVPQLLQQIKVGTFVDHGPNTENDELAPEGYAAYLKAIGTTSRIVVKPGDRIPVPGINVEVVAGAGKAITSPLPGAGQPNPYCASEPPAPADPSENAASLGVMISYGSFRFLDLGDLTRAKELSLVCPKNLLGQVDLFLISHHGFFLSNSKAMVDALHPRVAININSTHKGGDAKAWQIVHDSPGLQDLWQLHYAIAAGPEHSSPADFVANTDDDSDGHWIKASALPDGSFAVLNSRNSFEKSYKK
jgi:beta-lactamase superfamily II metal-dependent hydrolase